MNIKKKSTKLSAVCVRAARPKAQVPSKTPRRFLVVFPWVDLAKGEESDEYARVTFGEIEGRSLLHARQMVAQVVDDGGALLDLLIEPGTKREVLPAKMKGLLGESGVVLGTPLVVPFEDIGRLDFDWALAYFTPRSTATDAECKGEKLAVLARLLEMMKGRRSPGTSDRP